MALLASLQEGFCGILNRIQSLLIGILCLVHAGVAVCDYSILLRKSDIGTKVAFKGIYLLFCCVNHQTQQLSQAQSITNVLAIICNVQHFVSSNCCTLAISLHQCHRTGMLSPKVFCLSCLLDRTALLGFPVLTCSHLLYTVTAHDTNPLCNGAHPKEGCQLLSFFYCAHRF